MASRSSVLLFLLLLLLGAAAAVLIADQRRQLLRDERGESFQHLTGGLGFGPALDLSDCPFAFDPRLDGGCQQDYGPIAGGGCFCPRHAGSIFFYPPLAHGAVLPIEDKDDALSP
ncbi:MAG: hypothetical protein ACYC3I_05255 [Gemmataceae bacterium]